MNRLRYPLYPLLLSSLLAGGPLLAQDSTRQFVRPALLKTNLLYPLGLSVEVPTTPRQSFQFSTHYYGITTESWFGTGFTKERYFNLIPEYRFYVSRAAPSARRPAPKGLYLGLYLRYLQHNTFNYDTYTGRVRPRSSYSTSSFGGGAVAGVQFIMWGGFVIDGFLGGGYFPVVNYQPARENVLAGDRSQVHIGLSIGGAFSRRSARQPTQK